MRRSDARTHLRARPPRSELREPRVRIHSRLLRSRTRCRDDGPYTHLKRRTATGQSRECELATVQRSNGRIHAVHDCACGIRAKSRSSSTDSCSNTVARLAAYIHARSPPSAAGQNAARPLVAQGTVATGPDLPRRPCLGTYGRPPGPLLGAPPAACYATPRCVDHDLRSPGESRSGSPWCFVPAGSCRSLVSCSTTIPDVP